MRRQRAALLALVLLPVLAGCDGREPVTIQLNVDVERNAAGQPIAVEIDKTFHDSAVVGPGDTVNWVCSECRPGDAGNWICSECPEGIEFAVENLHFAGDLDRLVDMFSDTEGRDEIQELSRTLQSQRASLPGEGEGGAEAQERGNEEARQEQEVRRLVNALKSTLAPNPSHPLFERDWSPSGWKRAKETIPSRPVDLDVGDGFWKFTWKVRLVGDEASERTWDPCIYGHRPPPGT